MGRSRNMPDLEITRIIAAYNPYDANNANNKKKKKKTGPIPIEPSLASAINALIGNIEYQLQYIALSVHHIMPDSTIMKLATNKSTPLSTTMLDRHLSI